MNNRFVKDFFDQVNAKKYRDELNYFTMQCRLAILKPHLRGLVLDVGFGPGKYHFKPSLVQVVAVDISFNMLCAAKKSNPDVYFVVGDAQHLPFKDNVFDTISSLEAINYLTKPQSFVLEAHRTLKSGGSFIIISISKVWNFIVTVFLRPFGLCPKEDILRHFYSSKDILFWLTEAKFSKQFLKKVCNLPHPSLNRWFSFLPPQISFILAFIGRK